MTHDGCPPPLSLSCAFVAAAGNLADEVDIELKKEDEETLKQALRTEVFKLPDPQKGDMCCVFFAIAIRRAHRVYDPTSSAHCHLHQILIRRNLNTTQRCRGMLA